MGIGKKPIKMDTKYASVDPYPFPASPGVVAVLPIDEGGLAGIVRFDPGLVMLVFCPVGVQVMV